MVGWIKVEPPIPKGPTVGASEKYPIPGIFRGATTLNAVPGVT